MKNELDRLLCERYPELFAERSLPVEESAMGRGIECEDGWFDLIDSLCYTIQWWISNCEMPPVRIVQVKEKCGTLRFHFRGGNDVTRGMKAMAETMSASLCETCGSPGKLRDELRYQQTLCDFHYQRGITAAPETSR